MAKVKRETPGCDKIKCRGVSEPEIPGDPNPAKVKRSATDGAKKREDGSGERRVPEGEGPNPTKAKRSGGATRGCSETDGYCNGANKRQDGSRDPLKPKDPEDPEDPGTGQKQRRDPQEGGEANPIHR